MTNMGADMATASGLVHIGRPPAVPGSPLNPPIVLSSTFRQGGASSYGRETNPTWEALEEVVGWLEGGDALVFSSGMAAIAAVIGRLPVGATVVVASGAYSGTRRLLADLASRGRLRVCVVDVTDTAATLEACTARRDDGGLLWLESPTNPLLCIADVAALAEGAHQCGIEVAVDNTFATPLLQRPLDLGADIVVHSATKSLAGHSDVLLGVTVSRTAEVVDALATRRTLDGAVAGPWEAWLALRGIRTLALRHERSQSIAAELANRLETHPRVDKVRYPGLPTHPGHDLASRQMNGYGNMVTFEVAGGAAAADAVVSRVRLATPATSLGGVETLIERRGRWVGEEELPPGLIRLSVGIEDIEDLWADIDNALTAAAR